MVLHYYSRMLFIDALLPNLQAVATDRREGTARVMSVLNSMKSDHRNLLWNDLDLKKTYTPASAKIHSISMTDVALHNLHVSIPRYRSNTATHP
ncbi:hypothetical protein PTI98_008255 [Pleurotus ostreatus]|nr:hypothetical protein PTI98_008255 [Pleurotus ostreatus]